MRGTLDMEVEEIKQLRITPAHAGNTLFPVLNRSIAKDHPRTCGEHSVDSFSVERSSGSPPHMRETHIPLVGRPRLCRITPAHAGNTVLLSTEFRIS